MVSYYLILSFAFLGLASALTVIACDKITDSSVKPYEDGNWSLLSESNKLKVKRFGVAAFGSLLLAVVLLWAGHQ